MKYETGNNASIITFAGKTPKLHKSVFTCEGVKIIGDVTIGEDTSIWYNTVIRGDVHYIKIGKMVNIQDMCMLHVTNDTHPLNIGNKVSIAHSVTLHGATLKDNCLIGMGAILLDGSTIEPYSLVAAGTVVRENFIVPGGTLVAGVPGKVVRDLTNDELQRISYTTTSYLKYVAKYRSYLE